MPHYKEREEEPKRNYYRRAGSRVESGEQPEEEPSEGDVSSPSLSDELPPAHRFVKSAANWRRVAHSLMWVALGLVPVLFLPFGIVPVDVTKVVFVSTLLFLGLVGWLLASLGDRRFSYGWSLLDCAVLVFVFVTVVSSLLSRHTGTSVFGYLFHADTLLSVVTGFAAYFLARTLVTERTVWRGVWFAGGAIVLGSIISWLQSFDIFIFSFPFSRTVEFNIFGSYSAWSVVLIALIAGIVAFPLGGARRLTKIVLIVVGLGAFASLLLLNYQLSWIVLALIAIIAAGIRYALNDDIRFPLVLVLATLTLVFVSPYIPAWHPVSVEARPSFGTTLSIAWQALEGWRVALGTGPATFGYAYSLYRPPEISQSAFWNMRFNQGYSFAATSLVTMGVVGVLALLFLVLAVGRQIVASIVAGDPSSPLGVAALALAVSFFFVPLSFVQLVLLMGALGCVGALNGSRREIRFEHWPRWQSFGVFMFFLCIAVFFLAGAYLIAQKYVASLYYSSGVTAVNQGSVDQGLERLTRAVRLDGDTDTYWRTLSQASLAQGRGIVAARSSSRLSGVPPELQNILTSATQSAKKATEINGSDSLNWSNLASVYESIIPIAAGADALARENYDQAIARDPLNPQERLNLARALLTAATAQTSAIKDDVRAQYVTMIQEALREALRLKPDYVPAYLLEAQTYVALGDGPRAVESINRMKGLNPSDPTLAFQAGLFYFQNGDMVRVEQELRPVVEAVPQYADARYVLGRAYAARNLIPQALEQFEAVRASNPNNPDIEQIIQTLRASSPQE